MGLTVKDSGGGDYVPVPEGTHIARCVRVIDLGTQPGSEQFPKPAHKVLVAWEIPDERIAIDGKDQPALIMQRYTCSLHKKAKLRADLESWRGRSFTDEELGGFALKNVLGAGCMITVVHDPSGKYANVRAVAKLPKGVQPAPAENTLLYYEIEQGADDTYYALSEKLRATIAGSAEWRAAAGDAPDSPDDDHADEPIPF